VESFETIFTIGLLGFIFSFALVMFLEAKDSIENKIANFLAIGFGAVMTFGLLGILL